MLFTLTVTPPTGAPEASSVRPEMLAVICPHEVTAKVRNSATNLGVILMIIQPTRCLRIVYTLAWDILR